MQISIVSSLTPEDEAHCAAVFFKTICSVLNLLPVAYAFRVTTTSGKVLRHTHSPGDSHANPAAVPELTEKVPRTLPAGPGVAGKADAHSR